MTFVSMEQSTRADWQAICQSNEQLHGQMPERITALLAQLELQQGGFAVNQLQHALQTATRALRDNVSEEMIVAALCHDIGKTISPANHAAVAAEILKPYVSQGVYEIISTHQEFEGKYYYSYLGEDPDARLQYVKEPWYAAACRFADEWDQKSFDPAYDSLPLEHFLPMLERVFQQPRKEMWTHRKVRIGRRWLRKLLALFS